MADISKIDKNFAAHVISGGEFVSIDEPPFTIYGVEKDEVGYFRIPKEVAEKTSEGVQGLFRNTSGGVVRFRTNTKWFAIRAEEPIDCCSAAHLPPLGATGFDAYSGKYFLASFSPRLIPDTLLWEQPFKKCPTDEEGFFEVTLNMPLYGSYKRIYVKVDEDAEIRPAESTYKNEKPVVFYGSSITQGGCASTPGTSYTNILSRKHIEIS